MAKTVLTLDEINLLLNSEEPKNTELYGNLYFVLYSLQTKKAVSLEQLAGINDKAQAALTYNKKTLIDTVIKEWYAEGVSEEDPSKKVRCGLCNTPNKYLYYIRNRKNNVLLNVGSSCINKFPNIDNYIEQKKQLVQIHNGHLEVKRRNEFYEAFPECEKFISDADNFFNTLPILLPYELYSKMQDTINRMRLIYTKYVKEGKKPFKSEFDSFKLFQLAIDQFEKLRLLTESFVSKNMNTALICKRKEINWLISNKRHILLQKIAENDGVYTLGTLKQMSSYDFVKEWWDVFGIKNHSSIFKIEGIENNNIVFSFNKIGYQPVLMFTVSLCDFMNIIGAYCIMYDDYSYGSAEILKCAHIVHSRNNLESVINYIYGFMEKFNSVFLLDHETNTLFLYRQGDRAIRSFSPYKFLDMYCKCIMLSDLEVKKYLFGLVKGNHSVNWILPEDQARQGIDDKIGRLYKEYKDNHIYDNSYGSIRRIEIMMYNTMHDSKSNITVIDFNRPEYIVLARRYFKIDVNKLKTVSYAIRLQDDSLEPYYHKNNILFIQNTQSVKDNNMIFFISERGITVKKCHVENEYENIFQHIQIKKNKLQAYGKIVYCMNEIPK